MFDFRYHALSLVSVFVALLVGLVLGVAIGDKGLVSSAGRNVREGLRSDVRSARKDLSKAQRDLNDRKRFERNAYPLLVQGKLPAQRIGIIGLGGVPNATSKFVRDSLK